MPQARPLIDTWLAAERAQRIFIAGSRANNELVAAIWVRNLEQKGNVVFFYLFCQLAPRTLCDSDVIGAFFSTAGGHFVSQSAAAANSEFLPAELAAAFNVSNLDGAWLMITRDEAELARYTIVSTTRLTFKYRPPEPRQR